MGRLKSQTATANRTLQHNGKLNTLVGGAVRRSYRYDKAGNLIQTADQRSGVLDYVYDKLGRIESAVNKQTGSREKFAFDPAHNILSDKVSDGLKDTKGLSENLSDRPHISRTKGRNIGKGNRLEAYNGTEYTYDALGNMIYRQLPDGGSQFFQYDSENRLVRAEIKKKEGNTEVWEYAYDPFGRRLSKERKDKLAWTSTAPKRTHFVWDGTRLLQEYNYKGSYTYVYTDQDSYEPLAQVFDNHKDRQQYLFYFHNNQIGTPHEMTDIHGNLLWYGSYSAWGSLASEKRIYENVHQPFRLQNQYFDEETGLHYNFFRYYEAETGRFTNQDPIGLEGGTNLYQFAPNAQSWTDALGLWAFLPYVAAGLAAIGRAAISVLSKAARASKKVVNKCVGKCDKENPNSGFLGSRRFQMNQPKNPSYQPVRNLPAKIGKRKYSGHALDRMQDRGIMPSVVENTIKTGTKSPSRGASTVHYDKINKITVVTNKKSKVVTVMHGGK